MRHISVEPPPFFHRGSSPFARLAFFGLLSIALLFTDTRYHYLEQVRRAVTIVLYPLQRAVQLPGEAWTYLGSYFATQKALENENADLKGRLLELGPLAQSTASLRLEHVRLLELLKMDARFGSMSRAAEVLYTGRDPFSQKIFVSKGDKDGVVAGQAVIDEKGVLGQVTRVFPLMSEVTLVTDKDHAVPVLIERNGVRSVLYGAGAGRPAELRFMSPNADIQTGDLLVTSGIDGTYPAGLAVAQVTGVERETGQMFARIHCRPLAGVDRSRFVLILKQAVQPMVKPEEPTEQDMPRKPLKPRRRG